ncbi:MAG TPA: O-antigen ligase family protein [Verrucomicrobiae bacterium]|nr:O-antigen ligase family protein [Verrucomicrobiae bacterium]
MPSSLALVLTVAFIAVLFLRDVRERANISGALWIPLLWIFFSSSRFFSQWLAVFGINLGGITVEDGSPVDAAIFAFLIASALYVLYQRRVTVAEFFRDNRWITIYLLYCLIACAWSDFPFVGFKRWIKLLGGPVMALVILTEPDPMESLARLMKRFAYLLLPLSICFIKYFPDIGRAFDPWNGLPTNTGVTTNKNMLGQDCMILGLFLFWHLLQVRKSPTGWSKATDEPAVASVYDRQFGSGTARLKSPTSEDDPSSAGLVNSKTKRNEILLCLGLLGMDLWVLKVAHSATSLACLILGTAIILFLGMRSVSWKNITGYMIAGIAIVAIFLSAGGFDFIVHLLGRNDTLTDRTYIWQMLLHWKINPIIGTGFEGFWLGQRRQELQSVLPFLNEAHNGYLETYLNIGLVGLALTIAMVLATYFKTRRALFVDFEFGRFRLAYLLAFICYNWTEAAFRTHCFPFIVFFLIAVDYAQRETVESSEPGMVTPEDFEPVIVPAN